MSIRVIDLRNPVIEVFYTSITPTQAVMSAYAQLERKDFHTWDYEKRYSSKVVIGKYSVSCGDFAALLESE